MYSIQNQHLTLTLICDDDIESNKGVLAQNVSDDPTGIPSPQEDIQGLYHGSDTCPDKVSRTQTPIF